MDQYTEAYSACLGWPAPVHHVVPITRRPPLVPAGVPVLIMSGTLDSLTPRLHGATLVASQMGKSARLVTFANLTHVTLQDDDNACPASVYQGFVAHPAGLASQNVSCAARIAPVHAVGGYPIRLANAAPARPSAGNTAGRLALQAGAVAVAAVGDEISRSKDLFTGADLGLRGGRVTITYGGTGLTMKLAAVRWVTDATIDGSATWDQATGAITAHVTVHPQHAAPVTVTAHWLAFAAGGQPAVITGSQSTSTLAATCPAP